MKELEGTDASPMLAVWLCWCPFWTVKHTTSLLKFCCHLSDQSPDQIFVGCQNLEVV